MNAGLGRQIAVPGRELPEGLPMALVGGCLGVLTGFSLTNAGGLPAVAIVGTAAIVGLTPFVIALGRFALPIWVALFGLLYPFARLPVDDPIVTFDRLFLGALAIGYLLDLRRRPHARESAWVLYGFLALTAAFLFSAVATTDHRAASLAIWIDAFLLPLLLFVCVREAARDRRQLIAVAGALAIAGATIATLGLAQRYAGLDLSPLFGGVDRFDAVIGEVRISGPFPAPEPFALVLLLCLAGTLLWIRASGAAAFVPGAIAIALELTAIFFTYFRAAWLGAVLVLLVAFVADQRSWGRRLGAVAVAACGLSLVFVVAAADEDVKTRLREQDNISGRLATYERGVEVFRRAPLFGAGFQEFESAVREVPQSSYEGVRAIPQAHSSIVSTLAEQGLVGFLPLVGWAAAAALAVGALWRRARDRLDRAVAIYVAGAGLAFLVMSATLTMIYRGPSNLVMALLLGLVCGRLDATAPRDR